MTTANFRDFMESCGLDDKQVDIACTMFDSLEGKAIDGNGMGQVLMCMNAFVVHVIRIGIEGENHDENSP